MKKKILFSGIITLLGILFLLQAYIQNKYIYPEWKNNIYVEKKWEPIGLNPDQLILSFTGFTEFLSGLLWIRADEFFHEGNYDAVLPLMRLSILLDPHNTELYTVGMWHMSYNFTDSFHKSDKRYIPLALALGKEGTEKNPNHSDVFFELGWQWYHKIDDFHENAVKWFQKATEKKDILPSRKNMLAHAMVKNNQIDHAIETLYKFKKETATTDFSRHEILDHNLNTLLTRSAYRTYKGNTSIKPNLSGVVKTVKPKIIEIDGVCDTGLEADRIKIIFREINPSFSNPASLNWDSLSTVQIEPNYNLTYYQDTAYIRNGKFKFRINMSKDPTFYPLLTENYVLELLYDPRCSNPFQQDYIGLNGEFLKDKYLRKDIRSGRNVLYHAIYFDKKNLFEPFNAKF